ncbi:MAG: porin [Syntrophaceae bacterium]|nr:porin [Syntrophaceae bacterium]
MKKFLVVLLSLGLIIAFSTSASAQQNIRFTGNYYVVGVYDNNPLMQDNSYSQAWFNQRLRMGFVLNVADGLSLTTRFDALENVWGDSTVAGGSGNGSANRRVNPTMTGDNNRRQQENIEWEITYMTFNTGIGWFDVGIMDGQKAFGTNFANAMDGAPQIRYTLPSFGPVSVRLMYSKESESQLMRIGTTDTDSDRYYIDATYNSKGFRHGLQVMYADERSNSAIATNPYKTNYFLITPFTQMNFGPVFVEAELNYWGFGKYRKYEPGVALEDRDFQAWSAYLNGNVKLGPVTVGGLFAYISGDKFDTDKYRTAHDGDRGNFWNPALILLNNDLQNWGTSGGGSANPRMYIPATMPGAAANAPNNHKRNSIWYSLYANYAVTPKLMLNTALTYATVAEKKLSATTEAVSDKLGWEIDLSATYQIFNNLSYMVGAGYLFAGDYFKGANPNANVENNYVLINRLQLNF